jgi:hypothetical protein
MNPEMRGCHGVEVHLDAAVVTKNATTARKRLKTLEEFLISADGAMATSFQIANMVWNRQVRK